jgi:putative salt-induced outer membrane protein
VSTDFARAFSENATIEQKLPIEGGDQNTVSRSVMSLKTKVVGNLSLKISYTMKYNEAVFSDTLHLDREKSVTIVYNH